MNNKVSSCRQLVTAVQSYTFLSNWQSIYFEFSVCNIIFEEFVESIIKCNTMVGVF